MLQPSAAASESALALPRAHPRLSRHLALASACLLVTVAACAGGRGASGPPVPSGSAIDAAIEEGQLQEPRQLVFQWRLNEAGSRLQGRGVARLEPPHRARLDLFTENGETAARVALVEAELRIPDEVDLRLIPPPPLLWASLGIFHPGPEAEVLGAERWNGDGVRLRYRLGDGSELHYDLRDGRIETAELLRDGYVVERVRLGERSDAGFPETSTYRDLAEFRELTVNLESHESVESFPSDIWAPHE